MFVLSHAGCGESVTRMLAWARRRWPGAVQAVIARPDNTGGTGIESAARRQGAMFYHSPMSENDWLGLLAGVKQVNTALTADKTL